MNVKYEMVTTEKEIEGIGSHIVYGLRAIVDSHTEVCLLDDISTDKALVENMCRRFSQGQVQPIHMRDIVIDLLS